MEAPKLKEEKDKEVDVGSLRNCCELGPIFGMFYFSVRTWL